MKKHGFEIERLSTSTFAPHLTGLSHVLHACVADGASVSFILPHSLEDSRTFWVDAVRPHLNTGKRMLWIAMVDERAAGTVQLDCDTPPNQPHRAEVSKLLVHPDYRRYGIARALMSALERHAKKLGRTLLTLDTASDRAQALYLSLGYQRVGAIPGFAKDPVEDRFDPTTIMFRSL